MLAELNEDYPKMRNVMIMTEYNDLINYILCILNLKTTLSQESDFEFQMVFILDFMKSKFGFLTIPEIKEAFKMYVSKDFGHKDIFRTLDSIVVADVLNCFIEFRAEKLRAYNQKHKTMELNEKNKISETEAEAIMINAVNTKYNEFLVSDEVLEPIIHIFQELIDRKILKLPTDKTPLIALYYSEKLIEAKKQIERELRSVPTTTKNERDSIKNELDKIISNTSSLAELRAKKLVLRDYFKKTKTRRQTKNYITIKLNKNESTNYGITNRGKRIGCKSIG